MPVVMLLVCGVFNLGFIAVSRTDEAERFLTWWEHRCLAYGYNERWTGLFVDQKWINLVPGYFDSTVVGFFIGLFVALLQAGIQRTSSAPEVSNKLNVLRNSLSFRRQRHS